MKDHNEPAKIHKKKFFGVDMPECGETIELQKVANEQSIQLLVNSVTDYAIYMLDTEGKVISWNSGAQRITQYHASEIIGCHFSIFYIQEERDNHEPELALNTALKQGKYESTGWHLRKDGSRFMANVIITPVYNEEHDLLGFAKVTRDMTAFQRAEEKVREGLMLKALVNTAVDGIMMIGGDGTIHMANPACEKLFGYHPRELLGQNFKMVIHPEFHKEYEASSKFIGIGREVAGRRKDGTTFPMGLSIGEAQNSDSPVYVGIMHDLTNLKRTEEQLAQAQKMETVGQLSGGIAHDFNNLLTVIIGNADLLSDSLEERPDLREICDTILGAGERGAELTQRLLAFSRRQTLQPAVIDCVKLVHNIKMMLRRTLSEDINITISAEGNLNKAIADPTQLETAILNLALNARDAMPFGGNLHITINNASLDKNYQLEQPEVRPGDYIVIAVTDDGEGMTPEVRQRVFEPFFTTKEIGKGSGLGLSMVYGFMKQSNGHVAIYSEPSLGTTVRLYLPAAVSATTTESVPKPAVDLSALRGRETILVAEDDPFVRGHAVSSLESFGYRVLTAIDGRDALAKLNQDPTIDALFSDVVMPGGLSGWELAEQAQRHRPGLKVLLTSGYPMETLAARTPHNQDIAILNKPYRKSDLGRRIRQILDAPDGDYLGIGVSVQSSGNFRAAV
ncbi:MAG: PAS domain S-box protein [Alphaproteobacteria bacterium]